MITLLQVVLSLSYSNSCSAIPAQAIHDYKVTQAPGTKYMANWEWFSGNEIRLDNTVINVRTGKRRELPDVHATTGAKSISLSPDHRWWLMYIGDSVAGRATMKVRRADGQREIKCKDYPVNPWQLESHAWLPDSSGWVSITQVDGDIAIRKFSVKHPKVVELRLWRKNQFHSLRPFFLGIANDGTLCFLSAPTKPLGLNDTNIAWYKVRFRHGGLATSFMSATLPYSQTRDQVAAYVASPDGHQVALLVDTPVPLKSIEDYWQTEVITWDGDTSGFRTVARIGYPARKVSGGPETTAWSPDGRLISFRRNNCVQIAHMPVRRRLHR